MADIPQFAPFFGIVEANDDELGRVQVRCFGYHTENKGMIPTEQLPWFQCVVSNSAGVSGIGHSPTGYVKGSMVFGMFLDHTHQVGVVLGSITGRPESFAILNQGFNDPDGVYPQYTNESDVNRLARGGKNHWLYKLRADNRVQEVKLPLDKGSWGEPEYDNASAYPHNSVHESPSGHIHEIDDTPGAERLMQYHRTGTYDEVRADGSRAVKVVGSSYEIIADDKSVLIGGTANLAIAGSLNLHVQGDYNVQVDGNKTEVVQGDYQSRYGSYGMFADGDFAVDASNMHLNGGNASGNAGIKITLPAEYDITNAGPVIAAAGRHAALDEPGFSEQTPTEYPADSAPETDDGTVKEEAEVTDEQKPTPELGDCREIALPIDYNIMLSDNYSIGDLSRNALFPHDIAPQVGLSEQDIVCNLEALANNIIEPLRAEFGSIRINSAFRRGSGKSQHNKGQAVDIQQPGWSHSKYMEVATWALNNLPVDQIIFEHGNSIWIHISFDRNKAQQRGQALTMYKGRYESGFKLYY